jgi:hypothetical protein
MRKMLQVVVGLGNLLLAAQPSDTLSDRRAIGQGGMLHGGLQLVPNPLLCYDTVL